jgi:hypothetical protein
MDRRKALAGFGALLVSAFGLTPLAAGHRHHCCPECGHKACCPVPVTLKEKKHCYQCECKDICIPGIKSPFAPCCEPPKCGRVRTIKVLKKIEYECEKCGYQWDVKSVGCDCCK